MVGCSTVSDGEILGMEYMLVPVTDIIGDVRGCTCWEDCRS